MSIIQWVGLILNGGLLCCVSYAFWNLWQVGHQKPRNIVHDSYFEYELEQEFEHRTYIINEE